MERNRGGAEKGREGKRNRSIRGKGKRTGESKGKE